MATHSYKDYVYKMQRDRFNVFKSQDVENGNFDVKFLIQDKIIYAHKIILTPISETLNAWLSDRWSNKDEAIKIETYSYDSFYEFLCFIYIGQCKLTAENIREMIDMAEFFGVTCLKELCDAYMDAKQNINFETIEELYDFAQTYSLRVFIYSIKAYIKVTALKMIKAATFLTYKKPFIEFVYSTLKGSLTEAVFEAVYRWAENQVMEKEPTMNDESYNVQEAIKTELYSIIPDPGFCKMKHEFLMSFVVDHGFLLSPSQFSKLFLPKEAMFETDYCIIFEDSDDDDAYVGDRIEPLELEHHKNERFERFSLVYQLAEKQAQQKQRMSSNDENFNIGESIKADLAEVFPLIKLHDMDKKMLMDFFLENGFLLSPDDFVQLFRKFSDNQQIAFKDVHELAEKQALQKQKKSSDGESFNVIDCIKADLAEVMQHLKWYRMDKQFLMNFVVKNGLISEEEANRVHDTRVRITNGDHAITGVFMDYYGIRRSFEYNRGVYKKSNKKIWFFNVKIKIPKASSTVQKMKGVQWYLCLERKDGVFAIKHHSLIDRRSDYLIAQMENNEDFQLEEDKQTRIYFSDNV